MVIKEKQSTDNKDMRVGENFICHQVVGVLLLLLLLSVTYFHMLFSATRAMSKVMVKLRRYHCLNIKSRRRSVSNPVTTTASYYSIDMTWIILKLRSFQNVIDKKYSRNVSACDKNIYYTNNLITSLECFLSRPEPFYSSFSLTFVLFTLVSKSESASRSL